MNETKTKLLSLDEGEGFALGGRAAGAADAVHIVFVRRREVEVDDVRYVRDIEAACSDVSRDEGTYLPALERVERALAIAVRLVAMD